MGRKSREEKIAMTRARLEEAAEKLKAKAEVLGQKKARRRGKLRLLPLAGLLAGAVALLRGERGKGLVESGKGIASKAGPLAGKAQSLAGKAREGVSQLRNR